MDPEESAATRSRHPVLMVDGPVPGVGDALAEAADVAGVTVRRVPSLHRACAHLERPEEQVEAFVACTASEHTAAALETARAVRHLRPELPIVLAAPDPETARKLQDEIEAAGISGVSWVSPPTAEAILDRLTTRSPR